MNFLTTSRIFYLLSLFLFQHLISTSCFANTFILSDQNCTMMAPVNNRFQIRKAQLQESRCIQDKKAFGCIVENKDGSLGKMNAIYQIIDGTEGSFYLLRSMKDPVTQIYLNFKSSVYHSNTAIPIKQQMVFVNKQCIGKIKYEP